MKKSIIIAIFAAFLVSAPQSASAFLDPIDLIDPGRIFDPVRIVENIPTPSYGYYDYYDKGTNSYDYYKSNPTYTTTAPRATTVNPTVTVVNNNYNYNNNVNNGGGGYYNYPEYPSYPSNEPLRVSCYSTPTRANVGDSVGWRSSIQGGNGDYYITWSGSEGLSGYGANITKRYHSSGSKYATVRVTSGGHTVSKNCSNNVEIYGYDDDYYDNDDYYDYDDDYYDNRSLRVSCSVNTSFSPVENTVTWTAYASGGSGSYRYEWRGTDDLRGTGRTLDVRYHASGPKSASVTVRSGSRTITQSCSNTVLIGVPNGQQYYPTYTPPQQPVIIKTVVEKPEVKPVDTKEDMTAAALFSLENVPWGWVAVLVIIILLGAVIYLIFSKHKIE